MSVEDDKGSRVPMQIVWETPDNPPKPEDYIFRDGKRLVRPYYFEFIAHVKTRWAGKKVVDLFAHEFRQRPYEYYIEAVTSGRIRVDGNLVSAGYIVQAGQKLSHFVHRHEPPVMEEPITILQDGSDVVTVFKPSSIPVHPCGQYRKNTVVGILQAEHGIAPLFPIHRLDRLVSGLLILAKNASSADRFRQEIEAGKVQKEYVAKVSGLFPSEEVEVNANVIYDAREGKSTTEGGDWSEEQPRKGKLACTRFIRFSSDEFYSIVKCVPLSGRTHQIRVHLQHLGHPIANDALYLLTNPPRRKDTNADRAARISQVHFSEMGEPKVPVTDLSGMSTQCIVNNEVSSTSNKDLNEAHSEICSQSRESGVDVLSGTIKKQKIDSKSIADWRSCHFATGDLIASCQESRNNNDGLSLHCISVSPMLSSQKVELDFSVDPMCTNCPNMAPAGYDGDDEALWLHCVRYSGPGWAYECPLPKWALI